MRSLFLGYSFLLFLSLTHQIKLEAENPLDLDIDLRNFFEVDFPEPEPDLCDVDTFASDELVPTRDALTWSAGQILLNLEVDSQDVEGILLARNDDTSDPATGDTSTDECLPILCVGTTGLALPSFAEGIVNQAQPLVINEIVLDTENPDTEFIELFGEPGTPLDGLSFIQIEGDLGGTPGTIDVRVDFGPTHFIGGNGFFLLGDTNVVGQYGVAPDIIVTDNLENSANTNAIVLTSTLGAVATGAETVIDAIAIDDGETDSVFFYGAPVIPAPAVGESQPGVRRVPDGLDTDSISDFAIADFFHDDNTPTRSAAAATPEDAALIGSWVNGFVALSKKRLGRSLTSEAKANEICQDEFGVGWRIGEFHDGDCPPNDNCGFGFWGKLLSLEESQLLPGRFWVYIDDEPANPWS